MLQIPRPVDTIILPSGARGELLVRLVWGGRAGRCTPCVANPTLAARTPARAAGLLVSGSATVRGASRCRDCTCCLQVRCNTPGSYVVTGTPNPHPIGPNFAHERWAGRPSWMQLGAVWGVDRACARPPPRARPSRCPAGPCPPSLLRSELRQPVMWTLNVKENSGAADPDLEERACTPLRPAYAADLRDESLAAAGAADKLTSEPVTFIGGGPKKDAEPTFGCTVNGKNFRCRRGGCSIFAVGQADCGRDGAAADTTLRTLPHICPAHAPSCLSFPAATPTPSPCSSPWAA